MARSAGLAQRSLKQRLVGARPAPCSLPTVRGLCAFLVMAALALAGVAAAQTTPVEPYRISAGDVLRIDVFGMQETSGEFTVGPSGTITMPMLGAIRVAGMTLDEATGEVRKRLGEFVRQPYAIISIDEAKSTRLVSIYGYVEKQGSVALPFGSRLTHALAAAGPNEASDLRRIRLSRPGQTPQVVDLSGIRTAEPIPANPLLGSGDEVYVPKVTDEVVLLGEVTAPATYTVPVGVDLTLLKLLGRVGAELTTAADRSQAVLLRPGEQARVVNLRALLTEGDMSKDVRLQGGDVVVIKEAEKISVVGQVNTPTTFPSSRPVSILEALAAGGGFTQDADLKNARIVSPDGTSRTADIDALWSTGVVPADSEVRPGDVLMVPELEPAEVLVVGAVANPSVLDVRRSKRRQVLWAINAAVPTPAADLSRINVYRGGEVLVVNARDMVEKGQMSGNLDLQGGDVVYVPEANSVYVLGGVLQPKKVPLKPGMSVIDAIVGAGGFVPQAKLDQTYVSRAGPDGMPEFVKLDLSVVARGGMPEPFVLKGGDIVYVTPPKPPGPSLWDTVRDALWLVGTVVGLSR